MQESTSASTAPAQHLNIAEITIVGSVLLALASLTVLTRCISNKLLRWIVRIPLLTLTGLITVYEVDTNPVIRRQWLKWRERRNGVHGTPKEVSDNL